VYCWLFYLLIDLFLIHREKINSRDSLTDVFEYSMSRSGDVEMKGTGRHF
jgi:hypothetical protein